MLNFRNEIRGEKNKNEGGENYFSDHNIIETVKYFSL